MNDIITRAKHHLENGTAANQTEIIRGLLAEVERTRQHAAHEAINVITAYMGDTCVSRDLVASMGIYFGIGRCREGQ